MTLQLLLCLLCLCIATCLEWQEGLKVYNYASFRSSTLFKFTIPPAASAVTWSFTVSRKPNSCDDDHVDIYLHHGSLPVVTPRNETFPHHFYLGRSSVHHLSILSDNTSVPLKMTQPTPGSWYVVAFRPQADSRIQQKGLYVQCDYFLASSLSVDQHVNLKTLDRNVDMSTTLSLGETNFRFYISDSCVQYKFHLTSCNVTDCNISVSLHHDPDTVSYLCTSPPCTYTVASPWLESWHYVAMKSSDEAVLVNFYISTTECDQLEDSISNISNSIISESNCVMYPTLDRYKTSDRDFQTEHVYMVNSSKPSDVSVTTLPNKTVVVPFQLQDMVDTGGSLKFLISMETGKQQQSEHIQICGHLLYGRMSVIGRNISTSCDESDDVNNRLQVNSTTQAAYLYVPYPEAGIWTVSLNVVCYHKDGDSVLIAECANVSYPVTLTLTSDRCVDNECSSHGECKEYIVGPSLIVYSTCNCFAGWRGYVCSDDSEASTVGEQLEELLLLTLSNIVFLPAIVLAIRRRFYTEAIVYSYNMFFSAMYHACDGDRVNLYKYCMMDYNILSFCDFLSSVCSLWFTMVAMATLTEPMTAALQVTALLVLPIGVLKEHTSLWLIAVPFLCGMTVLTVSWAFKCRSRRNCYPSKRRYLFCLLPGVIIAATGASVFAFAETTENYRYVHSTWHVCLFLSVVFLLPRAKRKGVQIKHSGSEESIQDLVLGNSEHNGVI